MCWVCVVLFSIIILSQWNMAVFFFFLFIFMFGFTLCADSVGACYLKMQWIFDRLRKQHITSNEPIMIVILWLSEIRVRFTIRKYDKHNARVFIFFDSLWLNLDTMKCRKWQTRNVCTNFFLQYTHWIDWFCFACHKCEFFDECIWHTTCTTLQLLKQLIHVKYYLTTWSLYTIMNLRLFPKNLCHMLNKMLYVMIFFSTLFLTPPVNQNNSIKSKKPQQLLTNVRCYFSFLLRI